MEEGTERWNVLVLKTEEVEPEGKARQSDFLLQPSERNVALSIRRCQLTETCAGLLTSRTVRQYVSVAFSH